MMIILGKIVLFLALWAAFPFVVWILFPKVVDFSQADPLDDVTMPQSKKGDDDEDTRNPA